MVNQQYLDPKTQKKEIETVRAMITEIEALFEQETRYEKAYERLIVSYKGYYKLLHRTSLEKAKRILMEGLTVYSPDIWHTATPSSPNLDEALRRF